MAVRVRGTCDSPNCDLYFDQQLFDDTSVIKPPPHWDVVLPGLSSTGITLCPWHSRTPYVCEGCKRMDGRHEENCEKQ